MADDGVSECPLYEGGPTGLRRRRFGLPDMTGPEVFQVAFFCVFWGAKLPGLDGWTRVTRAFVQACSTGVLVVSLGFVCWWFLLVSGIQTQRLLDYGNMFHGCLRRVLGVEDQELGDWGTPHRGLTCCFSYDRVCAVHFRVDSLKRNSCVARMVSEGSSNLIVPIYFA